MMEQYYSGQQFDFPRWLNDQGIVYGQQQQFLAQLTNQPQHIVISWGIRYENMPDSLQGFVLGYFKGLADSPAMAMQRQQEMYMQQQHEMSIGRQALARMQW
jgi:hypothetical protein